MAADKNGNPVPGTLVKHDVTHPFENDLYRCSHVAIQGTARPTHYHMLMDEAEVPAEKFQKIVESPPFQANLSGSVSPWIPDRNMNDSLPFQTTGPPGSAYDPICFGPDFQPQGIHLQPVWLPSADAVARMPQVDYGKIVEVDHRIFSREQLKEDRKERGIKTSRTTTKDEYVKLAQPVLPGVECWALSNFEVRARCKAHNVATPHNTQHDSKAVMAQILKEDDAKWGNMKVESMTSESLEEGEIILSLILFSTLKYILTFSKNGCHNVAAVSITFVVGRSLCHAAIDICLISSVGGEVFLYLFIVERAKVLANKRTSLFFIHHYPHSFNCLYLSNKPLQTQTSNHEGQHSHDRYCHCSSICRHWTMRRLESYPQLTPSSSQLGCSGIIEHFDYPG